MNSIVGQGSAGAGRYLWVAGHLTIDDLVWWDGRCQMRQVGGAAVYSALAARLTGNYVTLASRIGSDFPLAAIDFLADLGVTVALVRTESPCISEWILHEADGSRHLLTHPGSGTRDELSPRPEEFELPESGVVHIAPMPVERQNAWCQCLSSTGCQIVLDPLDFSCADDRDAVLALIPSADAFMPSREEADLLIGGKPVDQVQAFRDMGAGIAVVKLGERGSLLCFGDGVWHVPSVPVATKDTTGAGDAFCGAFAAALAVGEDGLGAARWATAAASFIVEVFGAAVKGAAFSGKPFADRLAEVNVIQVIQARRA